MHVSDNFILFLPTPPPALLFSYIIFYFLIFVLYNLLQTCEQRYDSFFFFVSFLRYNRATILVCLRYSRTFYRKCLSPPACLHVTIATYLATRESTEPLFGNFLRTCFSVCEQFSSIAKISFSRSDRLVR